MSTFLLKKKKQKITNINIQIHSLEKSTLPPPSTKIDISHTAFIILDLSILFQTNEILSWRYMRCHCY